VETPLKLTQLGTAATEVNEGHAILMPLAFKRGVFKGLGAEEIITVLTVFMGEAKKASSPDGLGVPSAVRTAMWAIDGIAREAQAVERQCNAPPAKDSFWDLNTEWSEPVWRWLAGATAQELCTDYEFYEGNLMRTLLKLVNILEEFRSLATLATDTEMLETMKGLEEKLLRDVATCDSLYLRL
jgi:superfamily II RNA helicase